MGVTVGVVMKYLTFSGGYCWCGDEIFDLQWGLLLVWVMKHLTFSGGFCWCGDEIFALIPDAVSDAHSAHQGNVESDTDSEDEVATPSIGVSTVGTPSTGVSTVDIHAPLTSNRQSNRHHSSYGSLSINNDHRTEEDRVSSHSNPETLGAVGGIGAGVNVVEDHYGVDDAEEMRGVVGSDVGENDEEVNTSLRVKIISLFKNRKRDRRRRHSTEDA